MKWTEQQARFKLLIKEEMDLLNNKGAEYASESDALDNFKKQASDVGVSPQAIALIFMNKHFSAIKAYIRKGNVSSNEPISGRINDMRNYLFLLLCLIEEAEAEKNNEKM